MRPTLVVDASVAVKWLLPEPDRAKAYGLQDLYQDEKLDLIAPHLLLAEVGNVLWQRARRGELTLHQARRCFQQLLRDSPLLLDSGPVSSAALEIAVRNDQALYDCLYLALALEYGCDLITSDERFFRAMSGAFRCVQLLRTFEPYSF